MALFQTRYGGALAIGTNFMFTWWAESESDVEAVADAAAQWATDLFANAGNVFPPDVTLEDVMVSQVNQGDGAQLARSDRTVNLSGGGADQSALPADVALVVSLRTALPQRSGRGRFYLPSLHSGTLAANGRVGTTAQTDLVDALEGAWSTFAGTGTPVVYSRTDREARSLVSFNVGDLWDHISGRDQGIAEVRESRDL